MEEYIKRSDALQFVFDACAECMKSCEEFDGIYADCNLCMLEGVKLKLRDMGSSDVSSIVHGKWKRIDYEPCGHDYVCSACNQMNDRASHYCPDCGAKMVYKEYAQRR